jgi:hypothetical protein
VVIPDSIGNLVGMKGKNGKYSASTRFITIKESKLTPRLFVHEYMHKKSAKHRFLRSDLLGIRVNHFFVQLDEAITEKITCEVLGITDAKTQSTSLYYPLFKGLDELFKLIPWEKIVFAYFNNDPTIFQETFQDDLGNLLCNLTYMHISVSPIQCSKHAAYDDAYEEVCKIIESHLCKQLRQV